MGRLVLVDEEVVKEVVETGRSELFHLISTIGATKPISDTVTSASVVASGVKIVGSVRLG